MRVLGIILLVIALSLLTPFVFAFIWNWTVPSLFPELINRNLIPGRLDWLLAFKFQLIIGLLFGWLKSK